MSNIIASTVIGRISHTEIWEKHVFDAEENTVDLKVLAHWRRDKMTVITQTTYFKRIDLNEKVWISIKILLKFVSECSTIHDYRALVQIMVWYLTSDKPVFEPMLA